jgi:hypothetical protein
VESHLKTLILDALDKTAKTEAENLVLTPKTLEEYLRIVGRVQGLRLAIDIIEETSTEYMKG